MKLSSKNLVAERRIPDGYCFCRPSSESHVTLSDNRNPHLAWSDVPPGTRSLVLICHDSDVPSRGDDVNQEEREIPPTLPRVDFYHWVLVDLDPARGEIAEGAFSSGVTPSGKPGPTSSGGTRQGINDYTGWFAADPTMRGDYYGYDGPCPPWNDSIVHHYHFTLYALDMTRCPVEGRFTGPDVLAAIEGHVLASARLTATYSLNPRLVSNA